jgi:hypothetical protein
MDFLRMYLGEITSVLLVLGLLFATATVATRYVGNRRLVTGFRNLCIAAIVAVFAASIIASLAVNQVPKARIDRSGADADQKAFAKRVSEQGK